MDAELRELLAKATQHYGIRQAAVLRSGDPIATNRARHDFELSAAALMPHLPRLLDTIAAQAAELALAKDGWHMANGVAELAMKHRDEAEAELEGVRGELIAVYRSIGNDEMVAKHTAIADSVAGGGE